MSKKFEYDVFLSYSSKDKENIHALAELLKQAGLRVWLDAWIIKPGDPIPLKIQAGLEQSRTLLMCMSPNYFGSEWGTLEHQTLIFRDPTNAQRRFVPLLIEDCTPPDIIKQFAYIDWRTQSDDAYDKILEACQDVKEEKAKPKKKSSQSRKYIRCDHMLESGLMHMKDPISIRILEKDANRRGDLFGRLMADLFVALGYEQPRLNIHKSGRELDLTADHRLEPRRAIGECKATLEPIGGDDLNKFVGALDVEQEDKHPITGYFISLAGFKETAIEQEKQRQTKIVTLTGLQAWGVGVENAPVFRPGMNRTPPVKPISLNTINCLT